MPQFRWATQKTPGGYTNEEVRSAFQKEIRRGNEYEALFWATELELAGYAKYVWKTMLIISAEDVGVAEPTLPASIWSLFQTWEWFQKHDRKAEGESVYGYLFFVQAVMLLARAKKSRMVDNALAVMYEQDRSKLGMEIPDYALDEHTSRGRRMGRGAEHFWAEAGKLENQLDEPDPYAETARKVAMAPKPKKQAAAPKKAAEQLPIEDLG